MSENFKGKKVAKITSGKEVKELRKRVLDEIDSFFEKTENIFDERRMVLAICRACVLPSDNEKDCFENIALYSKNEEKSVNDCIKSPMFAVFQNASRKRADSENFIDYQAFALALKYRLIFSEKVDKLSLFIECGYIVLSELICCEDEKQKAAWPILEERLRSLSALRDEARKVAFL